MKRVDERETQKTTKKTQKHKHRKEQGGAEALVKEWDLNDFVAHLS